MPSNDPQTVLLTSNLGSAGNYDPTARLARVTAKDSLHRGQLFLRATLDEMIKIRNMSKNLGENHHDLLRETRAQYDDLMRQKMELESIEKRNWISKLLKFVPINRAKRAFVDDTFELWDSTMTTSDTLRRTFLSTPTTDLIPVESESVAKDELLSGWAVDMNGPVTREAITTVQEVVSFLASENPFTDQGTPSDSQDGQTPTARAAPEAEAEVLPSARSSVSTSPSSPGSASSYVNFNVNFNIFNNTDANTQGLTINNNSSGTSGSTIVADPRSSVNSPPS